MPKKFKGEIADYNPDFLECRENHSWVWISDWKLTRGPGGRLLSFSRLKQCARCATLVDREYDGQTGRVMGHNRYNYVDGYLATHDNPIDAGTARLQMLRREGLLK